MKQTLAFILLVVLLLATACGSSETPVSNDAPSAGESGQQEDPIVTVFRAPT